MNSTLVICQEAVSQFIYLILNYMDDVMGGSTGNRNEKLPLNTSVKTGETNSANSDTPRQAFQPSPPSAVTSQASHEGKTNNHI